MKKIIITFALFFGVLSGTSVFSAEMPKITLGLSGHAGMLSATGHESLRSETGTLSSQGIKTKSEDMFVGYGSMFAEIYIDERFRIGVDYNPSNLESETTESVQGSLSTAQGGTGEADRTQKVQVDISDLTTGYFSLHHDTGVFFKAGLVTADVITNESLESGSKYANAKLKGYVVGIGYERALAGDGIFIRGEVNQTQFEKIALDATGSENKNHILIDSISGTNGVISIGKNF